MCFLAATHQNSRQSRQGMFISAFCPRRLRFLVPNETRFTQCRLILGRKHQVIHPLENIGCGFIAHPPRQSVGERVPLKKRLDAPSQQPFRLICQRPIERTIIGGLNKSV